MRLVLCVLVVMVIEQAASGLWTGFTEHKSEAEIARMTAEQLVEEYCREYRHRYDVLDRHRDLLEEYISRDAVKAMYASARVIDKYDPKTREDGSKTNGDRAD